MVKSITAAIAMVACLALPVLSPAGQGGSVANTNPGPLETAPPVNPASPQNPPGTGQVSPDGNPTDRASAAASGVRDTSTSATNGTAESTAKGNLSSPTKADVKKRDRAVKAGNPTGTPDATPP